MSAFAKLLACAVGMVCGNWIPLQAQRPHLRPVSDLPAFLAKPITAFFISASTDGCFEHVDETIVYHRVNDHDFQATAWMRDGEEVVWMQRRLVMRASADTLTAVMQDVLQHKGIAPALKEFNITERDKNAYRDLLNSGPDYYREPWYNGVGLAIKPDQLGRYSHLPDILNQIPDTTLSRILVSPVLDLFSTTSYGYRFGLVNDDGDTLVMDSRWFRHPNPWALPIGENCLLEGNGCYASVQLGRFMKACLPKGFLYADIFDNKYLLMQLADQLYNR